MNCNKQIIELKLEHLAAQMAVPAAVNDQLGCELSKQLRCTQDIQLINIDCRKICAALPDLEAQLTKLEDRTDSIEQCLQQNDSLLNDLKIISGKK